MAFGLPSRMIFLSSSSDLLDIREETKQRLDVWLGQVGLAGDYRVYRWETETDNGLTLSQRLDLQSQLPDPASEEVALTLCLFGERCGVPLKISTLSASALERVAAWERPDKSGRRLILDWPADPADQQKALDSGGFPLTGTVYELISAHSAPLDRDNLRILYCASMDVGQTADWRRVTFNMNRHQIALLTKGASHEAIEDAGRQRQGLFNLLRYLDAQKISARRVSGEVSDSLISNGVMVTTKKLLPPMTGAARRINPFKSDLGPYLIDDVRSLPGRIDLIKDCVTATSNPDQTGPVVIEGPSGCGKSSLLQGGLLNALRELSWLTFVTRPSDYPETDQGAVLSTFWRRLRSQCPGCETVELSDDHLRQPDVLADQVARFIDGAGVKLAIGLDQFEEVLDVLASGRGRRGSQSGWWQVLRFLGALRRKTRRVRLILTLEDQRREVFSELGLSDILGQETAVDASVSANTVVEIATQGLGRVGLRFDVDLRNAFRKAWIAYSNGLNKSSALPLAGLWLSDFYDHFEHLAGEEQTVGSDFDPAAGNSNTGTITLSDLPGGEVSFGNLIKELADDAWISVADEAISDPADNNNLDNLFGPLVALDGKGVRLLSRKYPSGLSTNDRLMDAFAERRLLVPAEIEDDYRGMGGRRLKLVHQAVIDHWEPAKKWLEAHREDLEAESRLRKLAEVWNDEGWPEDQIRAYANVANIALAAKITRTYRSIWPAANDLDLDPADRLLRKAARQVVSHATDPGLIVFEKTGTTLAIVAASDGNLELLTRFFGETRNSDDYCRKDGTSPLHDAAWADTGAVELLLKYGANPHAETKDHFHPIAASIQRGARKSFEALLKTYDDKRVPIGPDAITLLHEAARSAFDWPLQEVSRFFDLPGPMTTSNRSALLFAVWEDRTHAIRHLVTPEAFTRGQGEDETCLHAAARVGHAGFLRELLNSDCLTIPARTEALECRDVWERTPLMEAALYKRPGALRYLLELDMGTSLDSHVDMKTGNTLLHMVVSPMEPVTKSQRIRDKQCVEILLADRRVNPIAINNKGKAAVELAEKFPAALDLLISDARVPLEPAQMDAGPRQAMLLHPRDSVSLRLIRQYSRVLGESFGLGAEAKSGLQLLGRDRRFGVICAAIREGLLDRRTFQSHLPLILQLASLPEASQLRLVLAEPRPNLPPIGQFAANLLNAALLNDEPELVARVIEPSKGIVRGTGATGETAFHLWARTGKLEKVRAAAEGRNLVCPTDLWGRKPSDLVPDANRAATKELEESLFRTGDLSPATGARPEEPAPIQESADFAALRKLVMASDLAGYEQALKDRNGMIEKDSWGRTPADFAPDHLAEEFRTIELTHGEGTTDQ